MNMKQLQKENDELKAHVEEVNSEFRKFMGKPVVAVDNAIIVPVNIYNSWVSALNRVPPQSLRHIESRVEEETIERCVRYIYNEHDSMEGIADSLDERVPRKYSNQPETAAKEGE